MRLTIVLAASILSGCAATVIGTNEAREVTKRQFIEQPDATETVIVKRGTAFYGGGCTQQIFADGKAVADLGTGQKVTFKLPPGRHIVSLKVGCLIGQVRELTLELSGAQTRTIFTDMSDGGPVIQETAF